MRLASGWVSACLVMACLAGISSTAGCTAGAEPPHRDAGVDAPPRDAGMDSGVVSCTDDTECNDAIACTADSCAVGNVCRNTPLDELCASGERCVVGTGCRAGMPSACETSADCDDGSSCNGVEECIGPVGSRTCVMGTPRDCNDGNACTVDVCDSDPSIDGCRYETAPGCDAGVALTDGGTPCDPFTAADYVGTFRMVPGQAQGCGTFTYNVNDLVFSVSGGTLSVRADSFVLTQTPAPTDGTFDVTLTEGCGTFRVSGTFTCADRFTGRWQASFSGADCGFCSRQDVAIVGIRR